MVSRINAFALRALAQSKQDEGQTMAEYGLILALVAVLCIAAFTALQGGIAGTLGSVTAKL